jgi:diaminohydroxyphosphoribosylaminopyrimidine deaminase/5-amino-6-(5-phosphoribosylamino)uracil reductase
LNQTDRGYLERALDLAEKGRGRTSPNPIVGAVVVRDGVLLGEGWHAGPGLDHAEVAAIRDALRRGGSEQGENAGKVDWDMVRELCSGATMYVTLEPCCTQGRTPPCTTALIDGGFSRVVAAAVDPSPAVDGRGFEVLRSEGIVVEVADGLLAQRARRQNNGLRKSVTKGLPFAEYKYALTLDGRVATDSGESRWISSVESRALVHKWRSWADAVVVGAGTAAADNPTLTARDVECVHQPLRVVIGKECALRADSNLVRTAAAGPVLMVCGEQVGAERLAEVQGWGVQTAAVGLNSEGHLDPEQVGRLLASRGVQSVLLEGGPRLAGAWWSAGLVDKVSAFVCPRVASGLGNAGPLRGRGAVTMQEAMELREVEVQRVGPDVLVTGYVGGPF